MVTQLYRPNGSKVSTKIALWTVGRSVQIMHCDVNLPRMKKNCNAYAWKGLITVRNLSSQEVKLEHMGYLFTDQ